MRRMPIKSYTWDFEVSWIEPDKIQNFVLGGTVLSVTTRSLEIFFSNLVFWFAFIVNLRSQYFCNIQKNGPIDTNRPYKSPIKKKKKFLSVGYFKILSVVVVIVVPQPTPGCVGA